MTTAPPPGAGQTRDPRGDALRGKIKGQAGREGRRSHPPFSREPAGTQRGAAPESKPEAGVAPERNDRAQTSSGPSTSRPELVGSRTSWCSRPFAHPREQPQPPQPSRTVLGSAHCGHRAVPVPNFADTGTTAPPGLEVPPSTPAAHTTDGLQFPECPGARPGLRVVMRTISALGSLS